MSVQVFGTFFSYLFSIYFNYFYFLIVESYFLIVNTYLSVKSSLYSLDNNAFSDVSFENIFSQSVTYLFIFLTVSFAVQGVASFHLTVLLLIYCLLLTF